MHWAKRRFEDTGYVQYMDRLKTLLFANPIFHTKFLIVALGNDYFIAVPDQVLLAGFDGFSIVSEQDVPNKPDVYLVGDFGKSRRRRDRR